MYRSQTITIPAPVGGWNARDSLDLMGPTDAISLVNFYPKTSDIEIRSGFTSHSTSLGSGVVEFLAEFSSEAGTRQLIAGANGNIYNSSAAAAATSLGSGFSSNRWQSTMFKNYLIMCNGTDQPQSWNGTTLAAATYTGIADDAKLVSVNVYKSRLYFVEINTASIWYGASSTVTGALTELDVSDQLRRGGSVIYAGSYTQDTGGGINDIFVIVTNMGEVLLYTGTYPGDSSWSIAGRFYLSQPVGRRAVANIDSDLVIITEDGVVRLSALLAGSSLSDKAAYITNRIDTAFREAIRAYGSNFGWETKIYPRGGYGIVNVPLATGGQAEQFIVNLKTGAWTRFMGQNAVTWCTYNQTLYFGGLDGTVYKADYGANDNGSRIEARAKLAFNYFDDRSRIKQMLMARPLILGDQAIEFSFGVDMDFADQALTDLVTLDGSSGSTWDVATWDIADWDSPTVASQDWYNLNGLGRCAALKFGGQFKNASFSLAAINIMYQSGGLL